jgi:rhomboid protease GluP
MNEPLQSPQPQVRLALPVHKPVVTWVLLALILVVFGLETLAGGSTQTEVLVRLGAKVTPLIAAGEYWRLFTAMFLHIGVMHLFFNGYALLVLGTELERLVGWGRFAAIYLLSGLLGSLASYAFSPSVSAGASGAIFGLIGALAAFFILHRQALGTWGQRRLANIAFLIAINLFLGVTQSWIDNWGHMGGLLGGLALGWALAPRYEVDPVGMRLVDRNSLRRYWPALVGMGVLLLGGTALVTARQVDSYESGLLRAEEALQQQDWDAALAELEQVQARHPDQVEATLYFYLGLVHNYREEPLPAAQAYESALALEPNEAAIRWNLALTYLALQRYDEARQQLEQYLALEPGAIDEAQPYLDELRRLAPSP